eukprot:235029_1
MAFLSMARIASRHFTKTQQSTFNLCCRFKTYLVGVDGSGYGFSALKSTVESAHNGDEIFCMYFPPNIELMMVQPPTISVISKEIYNEMHEHTLKIEGKCKEIMQKYVPKDKEVRFEMRIGEHSFSPKQDLIKECYQTKADVLVLGSKGISQSLRQKVSETLSRAGNVTDFCVHNAPCDVIVVKVDQVHPDCCLKKQ